MCEKKKLNNFFNRINLNEDNDLFDNRNYISKDNNFYTKFITEEIPNKISGTYIQDYNILYINDIIIKKLNYEKYTILDNLKRRYNELEIFLSKPQTFLINKLYVNEFENIKSKIRAIESGENIKEYKKRVDNIINNYKKLKNPIKTYVFDMDNVKPKDDLSIKHYEHINNIEKFFVIAKDYIDININRIIEKNENICKKCGEGLNNIEYSEDGTIICPNNECLTEYKSISFEKMAKDNLRINITILSEDESIDNFLKAFIRYQGLQHDIPPNSIYNELDEYFTSHDFPKGSEIKKLALNSRGRRGETNHKMLWDALSNINKSEYYEHSNFIGHNYWGWTLHNLLHIKQKLVDKYNKTQSVFYKIPLCDKERDSSLGTQYRLWRHLQLEGHECYMDEFKIAENIDSLRIHNKLWKLMCEGCNDPTIYYII